VRKKLEDIVRFSTGIYEKPGLHGEVYYVQARHFDLKRNWIPSVLPDLPYSTRLDKHLLKPGDVLLTAKGNRPFAVVYSGLVKPAVASSLFMVLKPNEEILSEFLCLFLNHPNTQRLLIEASKGTSLASFTIGDVASLELNLPVIEKQKKIVEYCQLVDKRKAIISEIEELHNTITHHQLSNLFL
jgi:hypothetical protein